MRREHLDEKGVKKRTQPFKIGYEQYCKCLKNTKLATYLDVASFETDPYT